MNEEEIATYHKEWLQQPVTVELRKLLSQREASIIQSIGKAAFNEEDKQLRSLGNQLRTLQADIALIFDTTTFVNSVISAKQLTRK